MGRASHNPGESDLAEPLAGRAAEFSTTRIRSTKERTIDAEGAITIERAQSEDIPAVTALLTQTWLDTYGAYLSEQTIRAVTAVWHDPARLAAETQDRAIYFAIARTDTGSIVGMTTAREIGDRTLFLSRLYIHPDYQRRGIGGRLLRAAMRTFPSARVCQLEVETLNEQARLFYERQGFRENGRRQFPIGDGAIEVRMMEVEIVRDGAV
ncbi:MAG: GNAT family N-acetyltransferase [Chloroflexota bacterium]|nr:MAG: GNAT family N-acetyltransferase [Chloroflexota bacterium]